MLRTFFAAIFCLSSFVTGCYAPRSFDPLLKEHWPEKATAILPITTASIQSYNPDISAEKAAKVANAVLNTETKSTNDMIVGPSELLSILGDEESLRQFSECLNAPLGESWKVQELSEFSKRIGIETIVRINIIVNSPFARDVSDGGHFRGTKVLGDVVINAELIDLNLISTRITNRSTGKAEYWSTKGWIGGTGPGGFFVMPVEYGKTFGRAVDQATRDSLEHLFKHESNQKDRFSEHLSGLVRDEKTGLEWFVGPDKDATLNEAKSWVENLSVEGGGWRLPTFDELISLNPWKPGKCSITTSLKTSGWWVWACDIHSSAWQFSSNIGFGRLEDTQKPSARGFAVRFQKNVSTEEAKEDYKNNKEMDLGGGFVAYKNGKLLDRQTGLEWVVGPDKNTTWREAKSWIENLSIDGGGWRLPTIMELKALFQNDDRETYLLLNTPGLNVWSEEYRDAKEAYSKISLFNCSESSICCDSFNKTRCFAVRSR